jgi:hypothetical protein
VLLLVLVDYLEEYPLPPLVLQLLDGSVYLEAVAELLPEPLAKLLFLLLDHSNVRVDLLDQFEVPRTLADYFFNLFQASHILVLS